MKHEFVRKTFMFLGSLRNSRKLDRYDTVTEVKPRPDLELTILPFRASRGCLLYLGYN